MGCPNCGGVMTTGGCTNGDCALALGGTSEYIWKAGDHAYVCDGPYTGAEGRVDFIDWPGGRALIDFGGGRKGGLTWVPLTHIRSH